jgi:hypothetical protein
MGMVQRVVCPAAVPEWFLIVVVVMWALTLAAALFITAELNERWSKRGGGRY